MLEWLVPLCMSDAQEKGRFPFGEKYDDFGLVEVAAEEDCGAKKQGLGYLVLSKPKC